MKVLAFLILIVNVIFANSLNELLKEYKDNSANSLKTVDEKIGNVIVYSQKELRLMQHNKLSDVLKELPLLNLNKNRYGISTPSLATTKATLSGFFRLYINDQEVSSIHTQSFATSWGEMPLDFVDYIEVYYGDSSFSLGSETGIYFIRVYTKSANKENSTELKTIFSNNNSLSQSLTHSDVFTNDWSYLLFLNQSTTKDDNSYKNQKLKNDMKSRYFYIDLTNDTTKINLSYVDIQKDNYMGLSKDVVPQQGEIKTQDYFINFSKYLLEDKSLKIGASYTINTREHEEEDDELLPIPAANGNTLQEYQENLKFTKTTGYISKKLNLGSNKLLTSFHIKNKTYKIKNSKIVTSRNTKKETTYSFTLEDELKINNDFMLIGNLKYDKYKRDDYLEDENEEMYRIGFIYTPFRNFGIKSFYTKTYLPPTFYNVDFVSKTNKNIQTQQYKFFVTEAVFTTEKSKLGITYHNVKIDDFIYYLNNPFVPGFINIDHQIQTEGLMFNYKYNISEQNDVTINYYMTKTSETSNNTEDGGYIKFMGRYSSFEYFASIIYKEGYSFKPTNGTNHVVVDDSFDLNLGATYYYTKDLSFSLKGENLLKESTESLFFDGQKNENFSLDDFGRTLSLSVKWVF